MTNTRSSKKVIEAVQSEEEESQTPIPGEWNSMKEKIDSHERGIAVISEKLDLLLRGQARMATELTDGPRSPIGRIAHPPIGSSGSGTQNREEAGGYGGRRSEFRPRNIELPLFAGSDPDDWTYRVERYFGLQRLTAEEQLEAAVLCLEGPALRWFRWENRRREIRSWNELKDLLLRRFLPAHEGSAYDRQQFKALTAALGPVAKPLLESAFMKGLSAEIQGTLRLLEPVGLEKTMELAEVVEANPKVVRAFYNGPSKGISPIKGIQVNSVGPTHKNFNGLIGLPVISTRANTICEMVETMSISNNNFTFRYFRYQFRCSMTIPTNTKILRNSDRCSRRLPSNRAERSPQAGRILAIVTASGSISQSSICRNRSTASPGIELLTKTDDVLVMAGNRLAIVPTSGLCLSNSISRQISNASSNLAF
ncbi:hypothetical protein G4B88_009105 [Cannabis sativa]|uniref:Retrotransposon gag domain-containing protein n=1 Tax=Cannabis sativa TaxID=3483 RepID=A0A7J6HRA8_CANSA|nr:hypothetical protein G4B88_009105 [Cannabis sativa]